MSDKNNRYTISSENSDYILDSLEVYSQYLASLKSRQTYNDIQNAIVRYFIPSVGGPIPSAQKRKPITSEEIKIALQFLGENVALTTLANSPDLVLKTLENLDSSPAQKERVRRDLRRFVDWARDLHYLPPPINPIPQDICDHIKIGLFEGLPLKLANSRQVFERFIEQVEDEELIIDATNAIVRFFIPGCSGPIPLHKPALSSEVHAALKYMETIPLEYLSEAISIATAVLKAFDCSPTHGTRIRNALRELTYWAREEQYLPQPSSVAPWGEICSSQVSPAPKLVVEKEQPTAFECYQNYYEHLIKSGREIESNSFQTAVTRYLVPALGGPIPTGRRLPYREIQLRLEQLKRIPAKQLANCIEQVEVEFERLGMSLSQRRSPRSRLKSWLNWAAEKHPDQGIIKNSKFQPAFNTFYTPGVKRQSKKPGRRLHENRCPTHALGAKQFPKDYINLYLQQQLDAYNQWRRANSITPGSVKTETEQILQLMGWVHRYEGVSLEDLRFECVIAKCQLVFLASEYKDFQEYLLRKEVGTQEARNKADQDKQRVQRYLDFTGENPKSQSRRLSVVIALAKFLYKNLLGTDDFPDERDIPVLRRLLDLQAQKKKKSKRTPQAVSYGETSVSWEQAVQTMEQARLRVEQVNLCIRSQSRTGFVLKRRPDTALANELQRFLSIAFCLIIPSRARTFYDLRIDETLKEGVLTEREFLSVQELRNRGLWEQYQEQIRFYIHHLGEDYKTGKSMSPALLESGGWWAEILNISFGETYLYDYIRRWLNWGRAVQGPVHHNFFFRCCFSSQPMDGHAWSHRIKTIFERWTNIPVPPKNIRKMFASQFPEHVESGSLLLQHSERIHVTDYDMRQSLKRMQPVMEANQQFIQGVVQVRRSLL